MRRIAAMMLVLSACAPVPYCEGGAALCDEGCSAALCSRGGVTLRDCVDQGGCEPGDLDFARCDDGVIVCPVDTEPRCFCD